MFIDAHIHLSGSELDPETLAEGERHNIQLFVGSSLGRDPWKYYPSYEEVRAANDDMCSVIRQNIGKIAGYCYVNPLHGKSALEDFVRRVETEGFIGLKLWVATLCNDPAVFPFIEQSIKYQAPVLIHTWDKTVGQLPNETTARHVADLAERYPKARIIMAHLGGQVEKAMNAVRNCRNVNVDTSGTPIGASEVAIAVERLGAERVIFGSDLPIACLASNIGKILGANLPDSQLECILGGNMKRLLAEVKH